MLRFIPCNEVNILLFLYILGEKLLDLMMDLAISLPFFVAEGILKQLRKDIAWAIEDI